MLYECRRKTRVLCDAILFRIQDVVIAGVNEVDVRNILLRNGIVRTDGHSRQEYRPRHVADDRKSSYLQGKETVNRKKEKVNAPIILSVGRCGFNKCPVACLAVYIWSC